MHGGQLHLCEKIWKCSRSRQLPFRELIRETESFKKFRPVIRWSFNLFSRPACQTLWIVFVNSTPTAQVSQFFTKAWNTISAVIINISAVDLKKRKTYCLSEIILYLRNSDFIGVACTLLKKLEVQYLEVLDGSNK